MKLTAKTTINEVIMKLIIKDYDKGTGLSIVKLNKKYKNLTEFKIRENLRSLGMFVNTRKVINKYKDIEIGDIYDHWTVIEKSEDRKLGTRYFHYWKCMCSCDKKTVKDIMANSLKNGDSKSCGCIKNIRIDGKYKKPTKFRKSNKTNKIVKTKGKKKIKKSFEQWCFENNHQDILNRWDYELNIYLPKDVTYACRQKFYFKCDKNINHKSKLVYLGNIIFNSNKIICTECNSFENWCIENKETEILKRWDYELNKLLPSEVLSGSGIKYWFKCPLGLHNSELKKISYVVQYKQVLCNSCNSFGQWLINKYGENALEIYWNYDKNDENPFKIAHSCRNRIWIKCQEKDYHESYCISCGNFVKGFRCPLCSGASGKVHILDSIGTLYPMSVVFWSSKNKKSPYEYSKSSSQKVWWKCPDNLHEDSYKEVYLAVKNSFRCAECVRERDESFIQEKVRKYISLKSLKIVHEYNCSIVPKNPKTKHLLPFDNEVVDLKLIIEVHGRQHYELLFNESAWLNGVSPKEYLKQRRLYDRYKKAVAEHDGYFYLEIPFWTEKDEFYKILIDNKIEEIMAIQETKSA